jgi:hypothetical protein
LICSLESMARYTFIRQKANRYQNVVVGKIRTVGRGGAEVLLEPRLAPELSCCWQDAQGPHPPAKPVQRNALGRKLSCCWQDCEASASDPGLVAVGGCVRRWPDGFPGGVASTRDSGSAICGSCPDRPAGIPDQRRSCDGGYRSAAVADRPIRCRPIDRAETSMAGKPAHNSDTAVGPYRVVALNGQAKNLETVIEYVPRPRRWLSPNVKTGGNAVVLFRC